MSLKRSVLTIMFSGVCLLLGDNAVSRADERSLHGVVFGHWDLPTDPHDTGEAKGALFDSNSHKPVYLFQAHLSEHSHSGDFRAGGIKGLLFDPTSHKPVYFVLGKWHGKLTGEQGVWNANIYPLNSHDPVGKMGGNYVDHEPFHSGGDGKFKGNWVIDD